MEIEGYLRSRGESSKNSENVRGVSDVTIVDSEGNEFFFKWLGIPIRLDDAIDPEERTKFYLVCAQDRDGSGSFRGVAYATQSEGKKRFYQKHALEAISILNLANSARAKFAANMRGASGVLTLALILSLFTWAQFDSARMHNAGLVFSFIVFFGTWAFFLWPRFTTKKRMDYQELLRRLDADSFDVDYQPKVSRPPVFNVSFRKLRPVIIVAAIILGIPFAAHLAMFSYWQSYDKKHFETALSLYNEQGPKAADELMTLAADTGTGEVAYLAALALAERERYQDLVPLTLNTLKKGGPREAGFVYIITQRLDRGGLLTGSGMVDIGMPTVTNRISKLENSETEWSKQISDPAMTHLKQLDSFTRFVCTFGSYGNSMQETLSQQRASDFGIKSLFHVCRTLLASA